MVRNYRRLNRPPPICSRGPYRRKREHVEKLRRWDCRDFIDEAVPDVDADDGWNDNYANYAEDEFDASSVAGYPERDLRDPRYTIFVSVRGSTPVSFWPEVGRGEVGLACYLGVHLSGRS